MVNKHSTKNNAKVSKKLILLLTIIAAVIITAVIFAVANIPKEVTILDGTTSLKITTNGKDPQTIIEQNGFKLGKFDVLDASQFEKENAVLIIKREMSVVFCENGNDAWRVNLPARTVNDVLAYLNIEPGENDVVEPAGFEIVEPGSKVTLFRAGTATLTVDGVSTSVVTSNKTICQILQENNITLGKEDKVTPEADAIARDGDEIVVTRVIIKEVKKTEAVAFETVKEKSSSLAKGSEKVVSEGAKGEKEVVYKVRYENGKAVKKEKLRETVTKPAKDKIILVGTATATKKKSADKSTGGKEKDFHYKAKYTGIASAYYEPAGNLTASGMKVGYGRIGVNPKVIPYGTKLYVTGYGYCVAADTGWGTTGMGRLADLYFPSEAQCEAWGLRTVTMYVLD